jgi:5-methylcytosine-specific restriction enzyme subunit McrC
VLTIRTIKLREHEATQCRLSKTELTYLLSAERSSGGAALSIGVGDGSEGIYDIRAGSIVGTLVWPSLQVLIRPKVDLENVFFLLGFRGGLAQWGEDPFPYVHERDFLRALAWAFDAELRRALRSGIARDYLSRQDAQVTLRGRIDVVRQIRVQQGRGYPIQCQFQEYSEDIALNQLIKAAQRRLKGVPSLGAELVRRLRRSGVGFTDVADVEYSRASIPEMLFTRLNRQWEPATRLALMILRQEALRDETGSILGTSFTVDMNKLFEKFIEEIVREETVRAGFSFQPQALVRLTDQIHMLPDLVLRLGRETLAVGDAKYIELQPKDWPHANLYQLLAYCVGLGLPRGLLIYANFREPQVHRVLKAGIELQIIGIDMTLPPEQLVTKAREAARQLVQHAQRQAIDRPRALRQA